MKTNLITFLIFFSFSSLLNCQIKNLPKNFPKNLLNKVFCGSYEGFSEHKDGWGSHGYSNYKVDWKVTISESEGIFVEYDYNALFEKKWGRTQSVVDFSLYEIKEIKDSYGDITEYIWNYRLKKPFEDDTKKTSLLHSITELLISKNTNSKDPNGTLRIKIGIPGRDDLSIYLGTNSQGQCGVIKSLAEIKLENVTNKKKEKESQIFTKEQKNSFSKDDSNIAHVNFQKLLDTLPSHKIALIQIGDFEKKGLAELRDMEEDLQKNYTKYIQDKSELSQVVKQYEEERIQKKNQAIKEREQELKQQIQVLSNELNSPILNRIQKTIDLVASRKKINYVVDETSTIFYRGGIDLTSEVILELLKLESAESIQKR